MHIINQHLTNKLTSIFNTDISFLNNEQLRGIIVTLKEAEKVRRTNIGKFHHENPNVRHTSRCQCGLDYETWGMLDHAGDVLADAESLLALPYNNG